jgi:predicted outer membrane protein
MSKQVFAALVVSIAIVGQTIAQQTTPQTPPREPQKQEPTTSTNPSAMDRPMVEFMAAKLTLCNNGAIEAAKWAQSKASNADVKQFADMLAKEHAQANEKLRPFIGTYANMLQASPSARDVSAATPETKAEPADRANREPAVADKAQPTQEKAVVETSHRVGDAATLQQLFKISKDAHEIHAAKCKEMVSSYTGADFDKAFLGAQVAGHVILLSELKALEKNSTGQFQTAVREMATNVDEHLKHAQSLCKKMEAAPKTGTESTPK